MGQRSLRDAVLTLSGDSGESVIVKIGERHYGKWLTLEIVIGKMIHKKPMTND